MSTSLINDRIRGYLRSVIDEARIETRTVTLDRLAAVLRDAPEPEPEPVPLVEHADLVQRVMDVHERLNAAEIAQFHPDGVRVADALTRVQWLIEDRARAVLGTASARAERDEAELALANVKDCHAITRQTVRDTRAERDDAITERDLARQQRDQALRERDEARAGCPARAERDEAREQRDTARAELAEACLWRDRHRAERDEARADRDAARAERDGLIDVMAGYGIRAEDYPTLGEALDDCMDGTPVSDDIERLTAERDTAIAERVRYRVVAHRCRAERDAAITERDSARAEQDIAILRAVRLTAERDAAHEERVAAIAERDTAIAERDVIADERDAARLWRDRYRDRCNEAREQRDKAIAQLAKVRGERDSAIAERDKAREDCDDLRGHLRRVRTTLCADPITTMDHDAMSTVEMAQAWVKVHGDAIDESYAERIARDATIAERDRYRVDAHRYRAERDAARTLHEVDLAELEQVKADLADRDRRLTRMTRAAEKLIADRDHAERVAARNALRCAELASASDSE